VFLEQLNAHPTSAEIRVPIGEQVGAIGILFGRDEKEIVVYVAFYFAMTYVLSSVFAVLLAATFAKAA